MSEGNDIEMIAKAFEMGEKSIIDFRKLFLHSEDDVECSWFHRDWDKQLREGKGHYAVEAFRESGKALALDTEIPTPEGFKLVSDIKPHDYVFGDDGKPVEVLAVSPVYEDHECYKLTFDDGSEVTCDKGHLWTVDNVIDSSRTIITAGEIYENKEMYVGEEKRHNKGYFFPLCKPVEYTEKELPINPYLLGVWLGCGSPKNAYLHIWNCCFDELRGFVDSCGFETRKIVDTGFSRLLVLKFRDVLAKHNLLNNKHIPKEYLVASVEQRLELLRGIVDSYCEPVAAGKAFGNMVFSSPNKVFSDSICELLSSFGIKFFYRESFDKRFGIFWKIIFRPPFFVSKLEYKQIPNSNYMNSDSGRVLLSIEKVETVSCKCLCVNNDSHLFLITRNYIPTHNSQYVIRGFCLYRLVYPVENQSYIVILKANQIEASKKLKEISVEYQSNPWLKSNLISVNEDNGRAFDVNVKDKFGKQINIRIEAYGKGAAIRGISYFNKRPHIIIADDLQDLSDSQSDTIQSDDWEWFTSDVLYLGKKTRIFMIGNNLGASCLIERVAENAEKLGFDFVRIPILNDSEKSNWEEYWSTEEILKERENQREIGNISAWMREKMCLSVAPEKQIFKKEYFKYYDSSSVKNNNLSIFITVDVAIAQTDRADYTSVAVVGVNSDNHWFLLEIKYGRLNPSEQIDAIFEMVSKYKPICVGVEKVAYQAALEHFLVKEMPKRNMFFTIKPLIAAGKKELRIETLQPRFVAGTMWFPMGASFLPELELELLSFPKGLHDDLIDSLAYMQQIASPPVGGWDVSDSGGLDIPYAGAM